MQVIKVKNLNKSFKINNKKLLVLKNFNLDFFSDSITVILGRSGCGKSTLLRILSLLEKEDSGVIENLSQQKIGYIFQEPRLMSWLNTYENIVFGIKKNFNKEKIDELLDITGLTEFKNAYPTQLSGGMMQRVAIARALAYEPSFILMDEPFAALDFFTRKSMQDELLNIYKKQKKGILFVTHSIDEAMLLGTKIVILEKGVNKIEFDLSKYSYPRDLLSDDLINLKKLIIKSI